MNFFNGSFDLLFCHAKYSCVAQFRFLHRGFGLSKICMRLRSFTHREGLVIEVAMQCKPILLMLFSVSVSFCS